MNHLTTLDAGFLKAEDVDRHVSLAIGALAVIEGRLPIRKPSYRRSLNAYVPVPGSGSGYACARSTSVHPNGWTIPTSILAVMCGASPCRGLATKTSYSS